MKEGGKETHFKSSRKVLLAVVVLLVFTLLFIIPLAFVALDSVPTGNVALIPIEGVISTQQGSYFGESFASSTQIIDFLEQAEQDSSIKAIVLEINSPGGSAVASDEVSAKIKSIEKPVISVIREVGASGGYWIASSTDYIIANRMSITGSIGVISSYLEFDGLMEKYGVEYQRLVAGKYKDLGTPYRELNPQEEHILQNKLDVIHRFFIEEVAQNRHLSYEQTEQLATGEFFLGIEAKQNGLIDELGNRDSAKVHLEQTYGLENVEFLVYQRQPGFLEILTTALMPFSFHLGEGIGSALIQTPSQTQIQV
ncbi:signal peptide peptidase SppA [Candidatus Woesearchaeota archaeon]|nr:signal peptide peptidase SppA [Candidatus Woesearchaeota archaeon]